MKNPRMHSGIFSIFDDCDDRKVPIAWLWGLGVSGDSGGELRQLFGVQLVEAQEEGEQSLQNGFHAALAVGLDIQRHQRSVEAEAQQKSAVAVGLVQIDPDALIVVGSDGPALMCGHESLQLLQNILAVGFEVPRQDVQAELRLSAGSARSAMRDSSV